MKKILFCLLIVFSVSFVTNAAPKGYKSALKEMLVLSGGDATFKMVIPQMISMMKTSLPQVPDTFWADLEKEFGETSFNEFVEMMVPVYQKHLTQEDIEGVISFYKTPVGQKLGKTAPQITAEAMEVGQQWGMSIAQKMQDKLKDKGYLK